MKFVALETSSDELSLALFEGSRMVASISEKAVMRQSERLLTVLDSLLKAQGWTLNDVEALAVGLGPGSFTGLRVGLSFVKGTALARTIKVVGISSLLTQAEACQGLGEGKDVVVWLDARKGLVFRGAYRRQNSLWQETAPAALMTRDEAVRDMPSGAIQTGDQAPHAEALGRLAWQRLARGEQDDPAALEPLYLRQPTIT